MLRELAPKPKAPALDMYETAGRKYIQDGHPEHYVRLENGSVRRLTPKPLSKKARKRARLA